MSGGARASSCKRERKGEEGCGREARKCPARECRMPFKGAEILPLMKSFMFSSGAFGGLSASSRILTTSMYLVINAAVVVVVVVIGCGGGVVAVDVVVVGRGGVVVVNVVTGGGDICGEGGGGVVVDVGRGGGDGCGGGGSRVVVFVADVSGIGVLDAADIAVVVEKVLVVEPVVVVVEPVVVVKPVVVVVVVFIAGILVDGRLLLNLNFPPLASFDFKASVDAGSCDFVDSGTFAFIDAAAVGKEGIGAPIDQEIVFSVDAVSSGLGNARLFPFCVLSQTDIKFLSNIA